MPDSHTDVTVTEGTCHRLNVPHETCYVRFSDQQSVGSEELPYKTARGEMIIADFDAEGRIVGLELVGAGKLCQRG